MQTATAIEATLIIAGFPEFAAALAVLLVGAPFALNDFCVVDPPADPNLTLIDIVTALNFGDVLAQTAALSRCRQWWARQMWFKYCGCTAIATPTPPAISNPGPGLDTNTNLPSGTVGVICYSRSVNVTVPAPNFTSSFNTNVELGASLFDPAWIGPAAGAPAYFHNQLTANFPVPVQWRMTCTIDALPVNGQVGFTKDHNLGGGTSGASGGASWVSPSSDPLTKSATHLQTALALGTGDSITVFNADHSPCTFQVLLELWCQNPNLAIQPCCPPDEVTNNTLNAILNIALHISENAGAAGAPTPIGWHDGAIHSALANAGSFPINAAAMAIRVTMTTPPSGTHIDPGNPTFYWDAGFITPIALTSPLRGQRLVFANETMQLPEFTDSIGYTLLHGTVVTITELLPTFPP